MYVSQRRIFSKSMSRYYGPGRSPTESEAMKNLCREEKKKKRRVQGWKAPEDPLESLKKFVEKMEEKNDK